MSAASALVRRAAASTIGSLFAARARLFADRVAVEDEARRFTYAALDDAVNRAAHAIARHGVRRGERVAILSENRAEYLVLELACAKLGAILACQNWRLSAAELQHCIDLIVPKLIVVSPRHASLLSGIAIGDVPTLTFGPEWERALASAPNDPVEAEVDPEDPLFILYTSGTTGLPKGAVLSHRCEIARSFVMPLDLGIRNADTILGWPPLYHMGGTEPALCALLTGGRVIVQDGFDPARIAAALPRETFGWISIMPGAVGALIAAVEKSNAVPKGVDNCGVMPDLVPPHEVARVTALLGASYCNTFGATETGTAPLSGNRIAPGVLPAELSKAPSPASEIRLLDADDNDVPDGEVGELAMRGPTLFSGYWRDEAATTEDFRGGWFHMGDMFRRRPDSRYDYVDRRKYLIKSGGENIYPAEIERVLLGDPRVADAVVVRRKDARWGEVPVALVVAKDAIPDVGELAARCRRALASFKQPKDIRIVPAERIARSTTGKIQRRALEAWVDDTQS
jgi:acyl-CoA synthetase (AMP-forming)/AMP-acid ligase II